MHEAEKVGLTITQENLNRNKTTKIEDFTLILARFYYYHHRFYYSFLFQLTHQISTHSLYKYSMNIYK